MGKWIRFAPSLMRWLSTAPSKGKRALIIAYDAAAMLLSLWLAFSIRLGEFYWPDNPLVWGLAAVAITAGLAALMAVGTYRMVLRFLEMQSSMRLLLGAAMVAGCWFVLAYLSGDDSLPRSVGFIYFGLVYLFLFFGRYVASGLLNGGRTAIQLSYSSARKIPVAIYGVNFAGVGLAKSLENHPVYQLRLFLDDEPGLENRVINGCRISTTAELTTHWTGQVEKVFLAMPFASKNQQIKLLSKFSALPIQVLTIPTYDEIVAGGLSASDLKPIKVEDLLERDVVSPLDDLLDRSIYSKRILVTGAGGSIGSEICRQIIERAPACLVLLDHSEFALYSIDTELRQRIGEDAGDVAVQQGRIKLHAVVGSILNRTLVRTLLADHNIDTVFHAAAYKHVPLLERNEIVGVENNVIGTKIVADACVEAEVERMTMISTDKAVRPTSVMGASKRAAELYVQALAEDLGTTTCFNIVRFGNVLDSSGSVVQRFRQQIAAGGPVTVTSEETTRFFMSIPEATQLVLQASAISKGGEVFVLDMGKPMRIVDLARAMISLSGRTERHNGNPQGDIEITYVGLRPGEKLHEELFIGDKVLETSHPSIRMARESTLPLDVLKGKLECLEQTLRTHEAASVRTSLTALIYDCSQATPGPADQAQALRAVSAPEQMPGGDSSPLRI